VTSLVLSLVERDRQYAASRNRLKPGTNPLSCSLQGGSESKLLVLSEYVNKTEKIGGMRANVDSYGENEAMSDIFT